ncbi:TPA: hypothetical protein ACXJRX_000773 [Serratia marcescens]|uniref:hypothetical protein n=1 Tax=Serratia marcescens TaxID=615 RepID=UPI003879F0B1|nr:hypothetical protein SMEM02_13650 [Serratia marcescens]
MKLNVNLLIFIILITSISLPLFITYPYLYFYLWENIDKVGALATAIALYYAIKQSSIARQTAELTENSNKENIFQQMFNLVLEQHNNEMNNIKQWMNSPPKTDQRKFIHSSEILNNLNTKDSVDLVREHGMLSPYMRILHHTIKTIRENESQDYNKSLTFLNVRYSSLVRSFIPNDLLKLVAINTLIINNAYFNKKNNHQYRSYHFNLKYYNFFEHLNLNINRIKFCELITTIELGVNRCLCHTNLNKVGIKKIEFKTVSYLSEEYISTKHKEDIHVSILSDYFNNINFAISFFYELPEKYLIIDDSYNENISFSENIISCIQKFRKETTYTKHNDSRKVFYDELIKEEATYIFNAENYYDDLDIAELVKGKRLFLNIGNSPLLAWMLSNLNVSKSSDELIELKSKVNFEVKSSMSNSCQRKKTDHLYQENFTRIHTFITEKFIALIDKVILLKAIELDNYSNQIIKNSKEDELISLINNYSHEYTE